MVEIWKKTYYGFEHAADLSRDIGEALDPDFNSAARVVPADFAGNLVVTIEYTV